jgi:ABC-type nitrate/sulfonate/bicarbonate transport system permease component
MAAPGGLSRAFRASERLRVAALRVAILAVLVLVWEGLAASGWLYRDVVPSLTVIIRAIAALLIDVNFYPHLAVTAGEVLAALVIGCVLALAVGVALGLNRALFGAFSPYIYYLSPAPKIVFFPIIIMLFGVGLGSKVAMGVLSVFFPVSISVAVAMREVDKVYLRVGRSFRATRAQMLSKIYMPAMRAPILNGLRLGFGVALIGTLLAETKLSSQGMGFLIIKAYSQFNMPATYALLILLFTLAFLFDRLLETLLTR